MSVVEISDDVADDLKQKQSEYRLLDVVTSNIVSQIVNPQVFRSHHIPSLTHEEVG